MPQVRGKGLGRALIEGCEAWARERGHKLLTVGVLSKNARAVRSYEGAGYGAYVTTLRRYL
jgi:GNAT superfamily N-acetyltransferase